MQSVGWRSNSQTFTRQTTTNRRCRLFLSLLKLSCSFAISESETAALWSCATSKSSPSCERRERGEGKLPLSLCCAGGRFVGTRDQELASEGGREGEDISKTAVLAYRAGAS
ncbi:hypothetical protein GQ53DRAFT_167417 [Thozetella sp. PMI_491]|nr:hypothetical protein GQ53DRAFT_167417 [Thozetella sp. PMI_491]